MGPVAPPPPPRSNRPHDDQALTFDSQPLDAAIDLLGLPVVRLRIAADATVAKIAVRLTEVTSDGRSWLVSYGLLNLTRREGHATPEPLAPGQFYDIELPIYLTGRRLRAGSRIRLALSESLWPLMWPSPMAVKLQIDLGATSLRLPLRVSSGPEPPFPIPIVTPSPGAGRGDPEIRRDVTADGQAEFDEHWTPSEGRISATGTAIERSGLNVEAAG